MLRDNETPYLTRADIASPEVLSATLTTIYETRVKDSANPLAIQIVIANELILLLHAEKPSKTTARDIFNKAITHQVFFPPGTYVSWSNWLEGNMYTLFGSEQPDLHYKTPAMKLLIIERDSCIKPEVDLRLL